MIVNEECSVEYDIVQFGGQRRTCYYHAKNTTRPIRKSTRAADK